jgi:PAS domain S-box-containing protein
MRERLRSMIGTMPRFASWPTLLIGIVVIKAVLSVSLPAGSFLASSSEITYFLLLLSGTALAIQNARKDTLRSRSFWVFLAMAYGLWALDQWIFLYYEFGLHMDVPDNSIADFVLYLHIVLLMAALATLPHRNVSHRKLNPPVLNAALLLIFWGFLYVYAVFPYQLFSNTSSYALGFDILYPLENWALILGVSIVSIRAPAPWKAIYLHVLGASALYTLSSTMANLAIDSGGYVPGKVYGLGLTAAVCWFVWIPLRARRLAESEIKATRSDRVQASKASAWAMLVVVLISIPIVWELSPRAGAIDIRTFRQLVAIAAIICLAGAAFIKEYLAKSELASRLGSTNDRLHLAMESGKAVGWEWDVKTGWISWFGDLRTNFGIDSDTYMGRAEDFFRLYIHPEDREQVSGAVIAARNNGKLYAGEFRVVWPDGTLRWVSAQGEFHYSSKGEAERMLGIAADITDRKRLETDLLESEERFRLVANSAPVLIWMSGTDKQCTFFNQGWLSFTGRSLAEQLGGGWASGVHAEDLAHCLEVYTTAFDARVDFQMEYRLRRFDGEYRWIVDFGVPRFESDGTFRGFIGSCVDITERKTSEQSLHALTGRLISAQEEERARIARELHDDFSQRLALLGIGLGQLWKKLPDSEVGERASVLDLIRVTREVSSDIHSLSHQLHSSKLEHVGLMSALAGLCQEISQKYKIEVHFTESECPSNIPKDAALCLFRVAQEGLANVVKHSRSKKALVELRGNPAGVTLRISDSGRGFDPTLNKPNAGIGIIGMTERLRLVGGMLAVRSEPNCGTEIFAQVPLTNSADSPKFKIQAAGR